MIRFMPRRNNQDLTREQARQRVRELAAEERSLLEGPFSQGDAERQQEINQQIQQISEQYGVSPEIGVEAGEKTVAPEPRETDTETQSPEEQLKTAETRTERTIKNIRSLPEGEKVRIGGDRLSKQEAIKRLKNQEQELEDLRTSLQQPDTRPEPRPEKPDREKPRDLRDVLLNRGQGELPKTREGIQRARQERGPVKEITQRDIPQLLDAQEKLKQAEQRIRNAPENATIRINGEEFSKNEAIAQVEQETVRTKTAEETLEEAASEFQEDTRTQDTFFQPGEFVEEPAEQTLRAGIDLMNIGQQVGEKVGKTLTPGAEDIRQGFETGVRTGEQITGVDIPEQDLGRIIEQGSRVLNLPTGTTSLSRGVAAAGSGAEQILSEEARPLETAGILSPSITTQEERETQEDIAAGFGTLGTQLGGLAVATVGGVGTSLREDTPGLVEGAAAGPAVASREFRGDPQEFIAQEVGEEFGEKVIAGALFGGAGLAASTVPTPEFTPATITPEPVRTTGQFLTGDLGFRAEEPVAVGIFREEPVFRKTETDIESGERVRRVRERGETGELIGVARQRETPVSRREFLRERLGVTEAELEDVLGGNALGVGPGGLVPPETTPEPEPDTTPEIDTDTITEAEELFRQTNFEDVKPDTTPEIDTTATPSLEPDTLQEQGQGLGVENVPVFEQGISPEVGQEPVVDQATDVSLTSDVRLQQVLQPEPEPVFEPDNRLTTGLGFGDRDRNIIRGEEAGGSGRVFSFAPDIEAVLFGETQQVTRQELQELQQQEFTGLESRPIPVVENGNTETVEREQDLTGLF